MTTSEKLSAGLGPAQPCDPAQRLLLFGIRQLGANGLDDACAAHAFVTAFGKDFRRPLLLLRTFMMELSTLAARPIQIAPWCCGRMTHSEATLLAVLTRANEKPGAARILLADLLGVRDASGVLATGTALAAAFGDQGMPLDLPA